MPWQEQTSMSLRHEFVALATQDGANVRQVCRRFGISPTTGYTWITRYTQTGVAGLADRSRRPTSSPRQTSAALEQAVLALRQTQPSWGGRKLRQRLLDLGHVAVPSASTITAILRRHGHLNLDETARHTAWQRFEHAQPNDLWQMDFKGHVALARGRCHPLTVLDDHSRFLLGLFACGNEQESTVRAQLTELLRRYGLPRAILTDNGPPWGVPQAPERLSTLGAWLIRLGIEPWHGRVRHPQTQGKIERLHRTLKAERLQPSQPYLDLASCQTAISAWREVYNLQRPHAALDLAVPASRYQPSPRTFPETLPPIEYGPDDVVRMVHSNGQITYRNQLVYVSQALVRQPVALRPTAVDGLLDIIYCHVTICQLTLHASAPTALHSPAGAR